MSGYIDISSPFPACWVQSRKVQKGLICGMGFSKYSLSKDSECESMEVEKHIAYLGIAPEGAYLSN
jgi:hypothetical protein